MSPAAPQVAAPGRQAPQVAAPGRPAPRVAVIGGGLAGITAAIALAEAGAAVTLLEARPRLGLSARRPASTMVKPPRDSATAAASPTPLPAPVTTAIFCAAIGVSLLMRYF